MRASFGEFEKDKIWGEIVFVGLSRFVLESRFGEVAPSTPFGAVSCILNRKGIFELSYYMMHNYHTT